MKVIGLMPVRNEASMLPHSLACLSGFCDVVLVGDQESTDATREVCRQFPKVVVLEHKATAADGGRWPLLDAARQYEGHNLLWSTDADELISPRLVRKWLQVNRDRLTPGTYVACGYYNLWERLDRYRDDFTAYRPQQKVVAFVDARTADYQRSSTVKPLHQPRSPGETADRTIVAAQLPILHLQWMLRERNQMKQAWYRCVELLHRGDPAEKINRFYAVTLPVRFVKTTAVPREWVEDVTFPDPAIDAEPIWQEQEILSWFDQHGAEFFEPLDIWHVTRLRQEFRRRVGRQPRPDRSHLPPLPRRAQALARRAAAAAWRRIVP